MTITPFRIDIPQADVDDLRERLTMARWPAPVAEDWSHGQPVGFIRELADQWLNRYDWRAARGRAQPLPAVPDRDRRADHPLPPRQVEGTRTPSR